MVRAEDIRFVTTSRLVLSDNQVVTPMIDRFQRLGPAGWWIGVIYEFRPGQSVTEHRQQFRGRVYRVVEVQDVVEIRGALWGDSDLAVVGNAYRDILESQVHELKSRVGDDQ